MILACVCGRRFRTPNDSDPTPRACPQCGGALLPEQEALVPAIDINVLIAQMKVLRDELVARDRLLRRAQAETTVLKAELEQLRAQMSSAQPPPPPQSPTPVPVSRELPSNRVPLFAFRDP